MYDGNNLISEITLSDGISKGKLLHFTYDANDILISIKYNGISYYYVRDLTGNIIGLVDDSGVIVVKYKYDAFGNILFIHDTSNNNLGNENPFIFKGYYYDFETSMYYCKTRYYVPEWCRWLNADDVRYLDPILVNGLNLFAYCGNNPVMNSDPNGNVFFSTIIFAGLIGAGIGAMKAAKNNDNILHGTLYGLAVGVASVFLLPTFTGFGAFVAGFAFGIASDIGEQMLVSKKTAGEVNLSDSLMSGLFAGTFNMFSFGISKNIVDPLINNKELLAAGMSEIVYSTIFELSSFASDLLKDGFGYKGSYTGNDLNKKISPKLRYPSEPLPVY